MRNTVLTLLLGILLLSLSNANEQKSLLNKLESPVNLFLEAEGGFAKILHHTFQKGKSGTNFNYIDSGGQDILFPFYRLTAGVFLYDSHKIAFLYQPLSLETQTRYSSNTEIDQVIFPSGTPVKMTYNFPFYRTSYTYYFFNDSFILGAGLSFQLRNATIQFESGDGTRLAETRSLGPVPAINFDIGYRFEESFFVSLDATGFYASSAILNGAAYAFEGSILDASFRFGYEMNSNIDAFINMRFLGGTANGQRGDDDASFTTNYLAIFAITGGVTLG